MGQQDVSQDSLEVVSRVLEELLKSAGQTSRLVAIESKEVGVDLLVESEGKQIAVEVKLTSDAAAVRESLDHLDRHRAAHPQAVPVLATRFMGPVGRDLCAARGVSWFDLSGNADMKAPGLRILIDGKPNKFKRRGRPSSVFAPKAARIARWLLMYGDTGWTQHQLADHTGLDKGHASRVLKEMKGQGLVHQKGEEYFAYSRKTLLNAWHAQYDFTKHTIIKGVMAVRSGQDGIARIVEALGPDDYAATGLAGAWFHDQFAMFRTATVYLKSAPSEAFLSELHFREGDRGANTWLVLPNDEGVFEGSEEVNGVVCAHPVQVYLDLKGHPERAPEAADHLRQTHLNWSEDAR